MDNYLMIMVWVGVGIMCFTLLGIVRFLWSYRPLNPRRHGRAGAHFIINYQALASLYLVSLFSTLWGDVFPAIAITLTVLALLWVLYAVWHRNHLLNDFRAGEPDTRTYIERRRGQARK